MRNLTSIVVGLAALAALAATLGIAIYIFTRPAWNPDTSWRNIPLQERAVKEDYVHASLQPDKSCLLDVSVDELQWKFTAPTNGEYCQVGYKLEATVTAKSMPADMPLWRTGLDLEFLDKDGFVFHKESMNLNFSTDHSQNKTIQGRFMMSVRNARRISQVRAKLSSVQQGWVDTDSTVRIPGLIPIRH